MTTAIIVAAGTGTRMGFDKLLASLGGSPVILHTLRAFQNCPDIDEIIVVASEERSEVVQRLADDEAFSKLKAYVPGGAERHFSVWAGLQAVSADCDLVAVHDGARPLIHGSQISRCVERARETGAAASARPVSETLKRADSAGQVCGGVDRAGLWIMETPQVFSLPVLREAYETVLREGALVTDEVSALEKVGHPVWLVDNETPNPKITWPADLALAERLLSRS
ncbi:MAG: 2-C-methyl-D-erythritol 4-phosphate cytidylyltransferase [Verrucomicrobiales bacterium]|nr:2-C-methyl-D-erythritol 4-phosphate cytidylyltransferase [Verrucomicrobiales bacterium]